MSVPGETEAPRPSNPPEGSPPTSGIATPVAGGGAEIAAAAQGVVRVEGAAMSGAGGETRVTAWLFRADGTSQPVPIANLPDLIADDANFVWVDVTDYAAQDLLDLGPLLGLHRRAVRTALSPWHRPRLDIFDTHFFVSATVARLHPDAHRVLAGELDLFVGNNFLVSAHKQPLPFSETVTARASTSPELVQLDSAFMLFIILDELIGYYDQLTEHVQSEVETKQVQALRHTSDDFLEQLVALKRYVFALSHLASQHREIFAAFLRPDFPFVTGDEADEYFEDLEARLARLLDALAIVSTAVTDAFDIYVSHMSQQTNQVIKVLTMVSTVLLPTTVIVSIFGTNLAVSVRSVPLDTPIGLVVMLCCVALVTGGTLFAFHRKGWI